MNTQNTGTPPRTVSVAEFLLTSPAPRKSKLTPFWDDIKTLRDAGQGYNQIVTFLAANGIVTTTPALHQFVQRQAKKNGGTQNA